MNRKTFISMLLMVATGLILPQAKVRQRPPLPQGQHGAKSQPSSPFGLLQARIYDNSPSKIYLSFSADITNQPAFTVSNRTVDFIQYLGSTIVLWTNTFYQPAELITISSNTIQSGVQNLRLVDEPVGNTKVQL